MFHLILRTKSLNTICYKTPCVCAAYRRMHSFVFKCDYTFFGYLLVILPLYEYFVEIRPNTFRPPKIPRIKPRSIYSRSVESHVRLIILRVWWPDRLLRAWQAENWRRNSTCCNYCLWSGQIIGWVTLKIVYVYYAKIRTQDLHIPKTFDSILKMIYFHQVKCIFNDQSVLKVFD